MRPLEAWRREGRRKSLKTMAFCTGDQRVGI